jgi:hypothetical protein
MDDQFYKMAHVYFISTEGICTNSLITFYLPSLGRYYKPPPINMLIRSSMFPKHSFI